ncbi:MAG: Octanoyltransferase LipM [Planctomycetota bacterium]|jgi:lipoate-protein ligase A
MTDATCLPSAEVLIDRLPMDGAFNMALDEALLELAAEREYSVVRIYRWSEPTVSLGCFQARTSPVPHRFQSLPTVRRLSGGGAILHDQELTYSVVLPARHAARHNPSGLYAAIHRALIVLLGDCGAAAALRADHDLRQAALREAASAAPPEPATEPFLCFLRGDPNDVVHVSGTKIIGSAQRRRRGVILQHGSILLRTSALATDLPGIQDLVPTFLLAEFTDRLPVAVAAAVADQWTVREANSTELQRAEDIRVRSA